MSKVKDLNGREVVWNLSANVPLADDTRPRSAGHLRARALLKQLYPTDRILEEVTLPIAPVLYLDFYLPFRKLAVEVQGKQHFEYTPLFHDSKAAFIRSQANDRRKAEWCALNGIKLAILEGAAEDAEWMEIVLSL